MHAHPDVLFLDFDGVLHADRCLLHQRFCHAERLSGWLQAHPTVGWVVSSTWRLVEPTEQLLAPFPGLMRERFLGATPAWSRLQADGQLGGEWAMGRYKREVEVLHWWQQHRLAAARFAVLDDTPELFGPGFGPLVVCDAATGLDDGVLSELLRRFA